jgi:hypothetical protein
MLRPNGRGISRYPYRPVFEQNRSKMTKRSSSPRQFAAVFALTFVLSSLVAPSFAAEDSEWKLKWQVLETPDLRLVYYDDEHSYVLPHLARCFENTMGYYRAFFDYEPSEAVTILLQDFDDYGYAGTSTIPNNYITLGIEPFEYVYETCPTNERFNWVINHEMVHVVMSEKAAGQDLFYRKLFFGKVSANSDDPWSLIYSYLTSPRRYSPRWYHEGIAVFLETWLAGGIGRALGGYDEMAFRAMVRDSAYFYDVVGLESEGTTKDFQIGQNSYLYGTRFMSYLAYHYGPESVIEWVNRSPGTKASFSGQFKRVYGRSLDDEWSLWVDFEQKWQTTNLDSIRKYPVTYQRPLISQALGSASRGFFDSSTRKYYTAVNYPASFAHIAAIDVDDGSMTKICEVQTPALYYVSSLAYDESSKTMFFTTNNGKDWRDLNSVDVRTGEITELLRNFRTGDLCFNRVDKSLWGVQHHNGFSSMVRIAAPYNDWDSTTVMMQVPFGRDIFDLDISPDGQYVTCSMIEINGSARLVRMSVPSLMKGDWAYKVLYEFPKTAPGNFVFSPDGRYLYGTAYQTGVSNVFRWSFAREQMDAISNCETGYFRPCPMSEDSLIVFDYGGDGLRPVVIPIRPIEDIAAVRYLGNAVVEAHPVVEDWKLGSPRTVNLDSVTTYHGSYSKWRQMGLASLYPVLDKYKDWVAIGVRLDFMDPVGIHGAKFKLAITPSTEIPSEEQWHAFFEYSTWPWTITAAWNRSDFYDFFGPTLTSRKGYLVTVKYKGSLISDKPKYLDYDFFLGQYGKLDELPFAQGVPATYDQYTTGSANLIFKKLRRTIGAVDYERGVKLGAFYAGNYVYDPIVTEETDDVDDLKNEFYSRLAGYGDLGVPTGLAHSSIWLRGYGGYSWGDPRDTFANFYFGGFGNNYVDHRSVQRYREYHAFAGKEIATVAGTNFGKLMLEWTLPPARFERLGFPWVYCTWMRTALFTTGLATSIGRDDRHRELINAGGQLDFRLVWMSGLSMTLSVGYAAAWEQGTSEDEDGHYYKSHPDSEFMISLKIL